MPDNIRLVRKWINQPSKYQPFHALHGQNVLLHEDSGRVWFTEGDVVSMLLPSSVLSNGWK